MSRIKALLLVAMAACSLAAPGCAALRDISIFSTAQEVELGQRVSEEVEAEMPLLNDPRIVGYVRQVGAKVASKAVRQDVVYTFKVIDDPNQANAFAVPGGNIYIFSGLLARMDSEAELAAVLGHETAHIAERHSMEALTRRVGYGVMLQAVLGDNAAAWEQILADVGGTLVFLKFSRADEEEADVLGLEYMFNAGYNAQGMVDLLELFVELSQRELSAIEMWLSTHPDSRERVEIVKGLIEEYSLEGGETGAAEYKRMVAKLR